MKEKIINLCNLIIESAQCKSCGGTKIGTGRCAWCNNEDLEFKETIEILLKTLEHCEIDEDILLKLYSIKFITCNEIDKIISQYDFESFLKNKFNEVINKMNNNMIDSNDSKYIIHFLNNHNFQQENILYVTNLVMVNLIYNKVDLSLDNKSSLIKHFTEGMIKVTYPNITNPKCIYTKLDSKVLGDSFYNEVRLNEELIMSALENNNYLKVLELIFHECTHTNQDFKMRHNEASNFYTYSNLLNSKEEIIRMKIKGYYQENYLKFSQEVEARRMQYVSLLDYLNYNNMRLNKDDEHQIIEKVKLEDELFNDETRSVEGKTTTVDELFDSLQLDVAILSSFPALNFEYKIVDNKLVRKTKEELLEDYNKAKENISNEQKETLEYLYKKLIDKSNLFDKKY